MYKYLITFILLIIWLYSTICLFCMGISGNFYIENTPIIDNNGKTYQISNFIPLCIFTNYFDKKRYVD